MSTKDQPIHVYDVWAKTALGRILHFDVILPTRNDDLALASASQWLQSIGEHDAVVTMSNCTYCHSESTTPNGMDDAIRTQGFAIYPMEGCPTN